MKNALVTGSSGFIGRHVVRRLEEDGWTVYHSDIKNNRSEDCRTTFRTLDFRFDLIVHCAAIVGGRAMIDGQPMKVATDLGIDSDLFQFVMRTKPDKVVYFSSSAAYPIDLQGHHYAKIQTRRLDEGDIRLDSVQQPDAIYGWVKLTGEQLARHANRSGANVYVMRPFSGYGFDQDLDYPFPSFIDKATRKVDKFEIWGTGHQVRDWIHVDDVVDMTLRALDYDSGYDLGPINLCTGEGRSMIQMAQACLDIAGHEAEIVASHGRPSGVEYRVGDPAKMLEMLGQPLVTVEEGITRAFARC